MDDLRLTDVLDSGKIFQYENLTTGSQENMKHVTPNHLTHPCVGKNKKKHFTRNNNKLHFQANGEFL